MGSSDSSPYKNFVGDDRVIHKEFPFFPHLVFSQKISSFLRTAIVAEIRFLISCFGSIFYVTLMPRYLTSSDAFIL